ncbi:MAG TPA: pilus assembly protein [Firmicutes bacterium]|nr:pilus assembly protein [Candidatus Fermentithermobacillaceae bacterium]
MRRLRAVWSETRGQALVEFSLVVFLLVVILFSILEGGLVINAKTVLTSAARETARVCAVEGGRTPGALQRLSDSLTAGGIDPDEVTALISPGQAIYGTTIRVELHYDYKVVSPVVRAIVGNSIPLTSKAVTRSEFVPR